VVEPTATLATARQLSEATAAQSLALLRPGGVDEDELYRALDLLVTSSYLEGRCCALARFGYSRDGRPDRPQSVFGLLCAAELPGGGRGVRG
jgi:hypothetical protein